MCSEDQLVSQGEEEKGHICLLVYSCCKRCVMAIVHSTLLLVVLLVGPATGESPLDTVNVGQITENLGMYFNELSDELLGVEAARVSFTERTHSASRRAREN